MAYQVLARKWRPQNFEEVVGQEPITRTLINAVAGAALAVIAFTLAYAFAPRRLKS